MQKRGQVYLLTAFVLVYIIYSLTAEVNVLYKEKEDPDFGEIAKNYDLEAASFVNSILEKHQSPTESFTNFTAVFTSYAKTKNPKFSLIYAFLFDNKLFFGNFLDQDVAITSPVSTGAIPGCYVEVPASIAAAGLNLVIPLEVLQKGCIISDFPFPPGSSEITFEIQGTQYRTKLAPNNPELVIVARAKKENDIMVFTKGRFI